MSITGYGYVKLYDDKAAYIHHNQPVFDIFYELNYI